MHACAAVLFNMTNVFAIACMTEKLPYKLVDSIQVPCEKKKETSTFTSIIRTCACD